MKTKVNGLGRRIEIPYEAISKSIGSLVRKSMSGWYYALPHPLSQYHAKGNRIAL